MTELSDLLRQANDRNQMSLRARAAKIGNRLSHSAIGDYQRGDHAANPDEATLQALADAYDLPLEKVQAVAHVPVGAGDWTAPPEVARLTRRQQKALTELIMSMAEGEGGSSASTDEPPKKSDKPAVDPGAAHDVGKTTPGFADTDAEVIEALPPGEVPSWARDEAANTSKEPKGYAFGNQDEDSYRS